MDKLTTETKETGTTVIEVNGIKMEVDLRQATVINQYKVGDRVKVLIKDYSDYKSYPGMIVEFYQFQSAPAIVVAYLKDSYSDVDIKFITIISGSEEKAEIAPLNNYEIKLQKNDILDKFDKELLKKKEEIADINRKKDYFLKEFGKYFTQE